jgi:hypothetical protein
VGAKDPVEPRVQAGFVAPRIASELPGIGLSWIAFDVAEDVTRRSSAALRERLRALSDRVRGADALALRSRPIPHAYRVLFRSLGLEPDTERVPVEEYMVERMRRGGFPSRGLLADALLIATVETEVGVWALDASLVAGSLGLGLARDRVVVADSVVTIVRAFGAPPEVSSSCRRLVVFAVVAPGVPAVAVEEALWVAWDVVENG